MNIRKIIQSVTVADIKKAQAKAKVHFEKVGGSSGQMNMIAFD